jgi:Replication-relaxation
MVPDSYAQLHRYDGAAIERGRRLALKPCAVQVRDLRLLEAVRSYRFLTTNQLLELFWPHASAQAGRLRLRKLFDAGYLERFRPVARRGSFPWTFQLGPEGHRLLQETGAIPARKRYVQRSVYDYGRVVHDLQLNGWVLAYRRLLGEGLLRWEGEVDIDPPRETRALQLRLDDNWSAEGLRDPKPRLLRPDALLELPRRSGGSHVFLIELDRTRRDDKNYDKFRRYDSFLCWWWRHHLDWAGRQDPPIVLFICQDEDQRDFFLAAADRELTGHLWHPGVPPEQHVYVGRGRILFACELDMHAGRLDARRLPSHPPGHPRRRGREAEVRAVRLPGPASAAHRRIA